MAKMTPIHSTMIDFKLSMCAFCVVLTLTQKGITTADTMQLLNIFLQTYF